MDKNLRKVLLLDTNVSSFPIFEYLNKRGFEVYVIGSKENDCLAKYTKNYIYADYSNPDALDEIIERYDFDYVIPGCNDMSYSCATKIKNKSKIFGIDSFEVCETINNKSKFRKFSISNGLNVPQIFSKEDSYNLKIPIIVKPVDAYSGRGVSIINNPEEGKINDAIDNAIKFSKSGEYVIEEFVEGQLYSHSAFVSDGKIIQDFIVIEDCTANPFTVDSSYVVYDEFPNETLLEIRNNIEILSQKLSLVDGLVHTQFIKTKDSFRMIEVTRRCPGDLYSLLIEKSTNFLYAQNYVKPFLGEKIEVNNFQFLKRFIFRHTISSDLDIFSIGTKFNTPFQIELFIPLSMTGDEIRKSPFSRFGLIFINCKTQEELSNLYNLSKNRDFYSYY